MYNPEHNCVFINAIYIRPTVENQYHDAVVVTVKNVTTNETKLQFIKDPKVAIYVTKKGLRTFDQKIECAKLNTLDRYVCNYKDRYVVLYKALNDKPPKSADLYYKNIVMQSPYVFGADTDIENHIKFEYLENCKQSVDHFKVGALDIETSVLGGKEIICASYTDWETKSIHSVVLKSWYQPNDNWLDEMMTRYNKEFNNTYDGLNDKTKSIFEKDKWTVEFVMCDNEAILIKTLIGFIHTYKPDFCGIWNISYDIPYIIDRAKFNQIDITDLFCHPDVPKPYRKFEWKEDKKRVDHITDKWHQVICTGYTYFYDAMCLYSRLRKVQGREIFYTLDYIANLIVGTGKMNFGSNATHYHMQTQDKCGYVVYNTIDTILPPAIDAIEGDVMSMFSLTGPSLIADFSHQTIQLRAQFYEYCKSKGYIPGSISGNVTDQYAKYIGNVGGAVLNPILMKSKGYDCLKESSHETSLYKLACDIDVSSFYPSLTIAFNISKATKYATVLWLESCPHPLTDCNEQLVENAEYIDYVFGAYPAIKENAVDLSSHLFNMPNYSEIEQLFKQQFNL